MSDTVSYTEFAEKIDHLDERIVHLEKKVGSQGRSITRMSRKVFNGFGDKIDNLDTKIESNKIDNALAHGQLSKSIGGIIKFGAGAFLLIFITLLTILGSIWLQDRSTTSEPIRMEVQADAFSDPNESIQ